MSQRFENWPRFVLSGEFEPAAITAKLRIQPTSTVSMGSRNPDSGLPCKASSWILACGDQDSGCDIQDQLVYMLSQLDSCKEELSALCKEYRGELNLCACLDGNIRGFWWDAPTLQQLAQLNVAVDCKYIRISETEKDEN